MADNVGYTPGTGALVAADDVGGVLYQRIKPAFGPDGGATDVSADAPLPVQDAAAGSMLNRILRALLSPLGYDFSLQRYRQTAVVESGTVTTVTTVTTVATMTNAANIGGIQAQLLVNGQNLAAWQASVRSRIT